MCGLIKLSSPETKEFWEITVLFEDEHLLALDKPSCLLTSPDRYDPNRPNLMQLLHRDIQRGAFWTRERQITYLAAAHRLDFETSGVLLLAKEKPALIALADQFGAEKPVKTYVALVQGTPRQEQFEMNLKLAPHPAKTGVMRVDERIGKRASTSFAVQERFQGYTLLQCRPATGRIHQIRVHLQRARVPIVGDGLYGGRPLLLSTLKTHYRLKGKQVERPLISRAALHAETLELPHPVTATPVVIAAPWPKDLKVAVKYLRRFAAAPAQGPDAPVQ
ncbi:MAG: RluA family pseudouridine synthase [Verrucomicrobiota bacterium]